MRFFPLFFGLVYLNYLIFGTKVNLGNTYTLVILKWFLNSWIFHWFIRIFWFLVSRPTGRWDLRSRVCPYVRPSVNSQRFLPFVNIALRSRDMFTAIWGHFAKIPIPLYILIRKKCPKNRGKLGGFSVL